MSWHNYFSLSSAISLIFMGVMLTHEHYDSALCSMIASIINVGLFLLLKRKKSGVEEVNCVSKQRIP